MTAYIRERIDVKTLLITVALLIVGVISVYSATYDARASDIFEKQVFWVTGGIMVMLCLIFVPFRYIQLASYPLYFASILLLLAVLLLGKTVSGSTSWFNLGALRVQPSEFAKLTTVLALATYLSGSDISLQKTKHLLTATGIVAFPAVLILLQPDVGTCIIYAGLYFPILYWSGASKFTLLAIVAPGAAGIAALFGTTPFLVVTAIFAVLLYITREHRFVAVAVFALMVLIGISVQFIYDGLKPYQQKRISTFIDPNADPLGAGYNIVQSKVAIGSGGFLGKGYLHGTQTQLNFIPEQWTDFIFCVPAEEFGFVGAVTVLSLLMALLARGVSIAAAVKNRHAGIVAIGFTGILATHTFINIGMSVGLLPVIGIPLPFLSYGGSALLTFLIIVGLLLNLYANRKEY